MVSKTRREKKSMNIYDLYSDIVKKMSLSYNQFLSNGIDLKKDHIVCAYIRLLDEKKNEMSNGLAQSAEVLTVIQRAIIGNLPNLCTFITIDVIVINVENQLLATLSRSLYEFKGDEYKYLYTSNKIKKKTDDYH